MDLKNIIAAIALSAAVIVLYGLFFAPTQEQINNIEKKESVQEEVLQNSEAPSIVEKIQLKSITRDEAINSDDRIFFENEFISGSITLKGGSIDDLELKTYNNTLGSEKKIQLLNPSSTEKGYTFNTGWASRSEMETPKSDTIWKLKGSNKLTANNPVKIYFENNVCF